MSSSSRNSLWLELLLVAAIFLATNINCTLRQKQNTYNGGRAWEGAYYELAEEFAHHEPLAADAPYVYRFVTPWLVSLISPADIFHGFRLVNITCSALACLLLLLWLRGYVDDWKIRVLLVTLFIMQWDAPPRTLYHSPLHADALLFVSLLAGLLLLRQYLDKPSLATLAALTVISIFGAYNREASLMVPFSLLAAHRPLVREDGRWKWRLPPWRACVPFACGFLAFISTRHFAQQTNSYSFLDTIYYFLYNKPILTYLHAWFLAFGPVLFIVIYDWKYVREYLLQEQWLALYLAVGVWFGFFGGTDTERLQYWSMPGIYLLLGRAIERHRGLLASWPLIALFAIGQILSSRILWTTPDYPTNFPHTFPIFQQFGNNVQFLDLFSYHGYRPKETISLVQFLLFGAIVLKWMSLRARGAKCSVQ